MARQPKYNKKWGNPKKVTEAYERGRQDALAGRPMNPVFKKHRNKAMATAYVNGYHSGQRQRLK
jgi:hypothetical protein